MRKISKISLVAAVAVAGFSTANAQPLEEAIKNVDVSGSVVYRYDNFHNAEKTGSTGAVTSDRNNTDANRYKIGLNLSSKVNDYVKFNSRFIVGSQADGGFASLNAGKEGNFNANGSRANTRGNDGQADVSLSNAYFGFTAIPNTVVNIGKQGLTTPYTVATDINGNEQTGTGILALTTVGPVTGGLGYFNNTNLNKSTEVNSTLGFNTTTLGGGPFAAANAGVINGGQDIYVATIQGDLDFVKLEAWYLGHQENFTTYTLAATSNIDIAENAKIGLEARYVNLKLKQDAANNLYNASRTITGSGPSALDAERDNDMFRLAVDGKFSIVNARLAYTKTGKDGGLTALDQDAKNTSLGWAITSNGIADADYYQAAVGVDILDNLNFTLNYGSLKAKEIEATKTVATDLGGIKLEEVYGQLTYKMSKNLTTYLRYGTFTAKENQAGNSDKFEDQTRGRIQVAYTF
ncbi:major outer membrane protein [Aliarcobacter cryaerophilus]|uniref:major outer membrane protein n=1 Tax=Aliarcobacter cryaerophilus TaxID=28198 RepID=UPI0021B5FC11|nr:major outer membrane protein [Aliarcobacter cryaerophilus]MCT7406172.1 major outer membrane protein [Aliarcobacter cryaerophilus]MCT7503861.1 major outer membrane protein [Aliarcobacter cryaerophilus]